jgi:hypothetical protein
MPSPIIAEVNSSEWGINLVENGEGVGLHHIKSVERLIPRAGETIEKKCNKLLTRVVVN